MKIALVAAGQPRFTPEFVDFMGQLKGFDSADIYLGLWNSDWAASEEEARAKVEKILLPNYRLANIKLADQPKYELPPHTIYHPPAEPENTNWWYKRRIGMWQSLQMAYNLIDQDYDIIIKFRLDGKLFENLDLNSIDLINNRLLFCDWGRAGFDNYRISDLFAIGTQEAMNIYFGMADHFKRLVPVACPNWEYNGHGWSSEHILGLYLQENNIPLVHGDFKFHINWNGRSKYTDKHYHHRIVKDPTE
jgi:hypothetical protein